MDHIYLKHHFTVLDWTAALVEGSGGDLAKMKATYDAILKNKHPLYLSDIKTDASTIDIAKHNLKLAYDILNNQWDVNGTKKGIDVAAIKAKVPASNIEQEIISDTVTFINNDSDANKAYADSHKFRNDYVSKQKQYPKSNLTYLDWQSILVGGTGGDIAKIKANYQSIINDPKNTYYINPKFTFDNPVEARKVLDATMDVLEGNYKGIFKTGSPKGLKLNDIKTKSFDPTYYNIVEADISRAFNKFVKESPDLSERLAAQQKKKNTYANSVLKTHTKADKAKIAKDLISDNHGEKKKNKLTLKKILLYTAVGAGAIGLAAVAPVTAPFVAAAAAKVMAGGALATIAVGAGASVVTGAAITNAAKGTYNLTTKTVKKAASETALGIRGTVAAVKDSFGERATGYKDLFITKYQARAIEKRAAELQARNPKKAKHLMTLANNLREDADQRFKENGEKVNGLSAKALREQIVGRFTDFASETAQDAGRGVMNYFYISQLMTTRKAIQQTTNYITSSGLHGQVISPSLILKQFNSEYSRQEIRQASTQTADRIINARNRNSFLTDSQRENLEQRIIRGER